MRSPLLSGCAHCSGNDPEEVQGTLWYCQIFPYDHNDVIHFHNDPSEGLANAIGSHATAEPAFYEGLPAVPCRLGSRGPVLSGWTNGLQTQRAKINCGDSDRFRLLPTTVSSSFAKAPPKRSNPRNLFTVLVCPMFVLVQEATDRSYEYRF